MHLTRNRLEVFGLGVYVAALLVGISMEAFSQGLIR